MTLTISGKGSRINRIHDSSRRKASSPALMIRIRPASSRVSSLSPTILIRPTIHVRHIAAKSRIKKDKNGRTIPHWTPEKLQTSPEYPLSSALDSILRPRQEPVKQSRKRKGSGPGGIFEVNDSVYVRTQIVSPRLCGMLSLKG